MTKFQEICKAASKMQFDAYQYRQSCMEFASKLIQGLMAYWECPNGQASLCSLQASEQSKPARFLEDAIHLDPEGWWHLGLMVDFTDGPPGTVGTRRVFEFMIRKDKTAFTVKVQGDDREFQVAPEDQAAFTNYYDKLTEWLKTVFEDRMARFLEGIARGRFGFRPHTV